MDNDLVKLYIEEIIDIATTKRINNIAVCSETVLSQIIINCKEILKLL